MGYSTPIDKTIALSELNKHLFSLEEKPDDSVLLNIPYIVKPFSLDELGEFIQKICIK